MNRLRISPILRLQFLGLLMLLGLGALAARLWWVQVARGAAWTARIRGSSAATVRITSGIILRISRATSRDGRFIYQNLEPAPSTQNPAPRTQPPVPSPLTG